MVCSVCPHEKRREIDKALVLGKTVRDIAGRMSLSKSAVHRHRQCIADSLERVELQSGITARSVILELVADLREMATTCKTEKREAMFLACADRLNRAADSFARINREVPAPTVLAFCAELGVSGEGEVRSALDLRRSMSVASVDDLEQEALASLRFLIAERPGFRDTALAVIGSASSATVLPDRVAGNGGESNGHG